MEAIFIWFFEGETYDRENIILKMISKTYFTILLHLYIVLSIP
jgi:hypothetical protein